MSRHVLQGPFLTRADAARQGDIPTTLITHRPDLLRLGGRWLQEVYFAFQFDRQGVRPDVGLVVQTLKRKFTDQEVAEWLVRPNRELGLASPLEFLNGAGSVERVLEAGTVDGPTAVPVAPKVPTLRDPDRTDHGTPGAVPSRPPRRRHLAHRPLFGH